MAMEEDLTLGSKHTMQMMYTDDISQNCTLEAHNFVNQCHPDKFNN